MIIPQENLATYISEKDEILTTTKFHKPSNVFFQRVKKKGTNEFIGFLVARFDPETNTVVDEKKFNGKRDTSFFKAVDYFEELINKNSPKEEQEKQEDFESIGLFVYFKGGNGTTPKIPIEKVVLTGSEAIYPDEEPIEFKDFLEASKYIKDNLKLSSEGYDKHYFKSTWTDGDTWEERFDIAENENNPNEYVNILGSYFLGNLIFYLAIAEKGGSTFGTPEQTKERALNMLEEYKKYDFQIQASDFVKVIEDRISTFIKNGYAVQKYEIEPYTKEEFKEMIAKYFSDGITLDPYIDISNEIITIPYQDVDKVFTPPQTKKYGRLDMTVLDDSKYDVVRSKFALKYTEEKSKEIAQSKGMSVEDVWVYEMQPYSNGTDDQEGSETPSDVNDKSLNASDIEGEEPKQREPKPQEQQQPQENQPQDDGGNEGEDEDLGWDEDKDSQSTPKSIKESAEEISNEEKPLAVYNMDLIEALNRTFQTDDILSAYKNPKLFMSALKIQGDSIQQFAPYVGLDNSATKQEILNKIEEQITPFYQ